MRTRVERILEEQVASAGVLVYDFGQEPPRLLVERPPDPDVKVPSAVVVVFNASEVVHDPRRRRAKQHPDSPTSRKCFTQEPT